MTARLTYRAGLLPNSCPECYFIRQTAASGLPRLPWL